MIIIKKVILVVVISTALVGCSSGKLVCSTENPSVEKVHHESHLEVDTEQLKLPMITAEPTPTVTPTSTPTPTSTIVEEETEVVEPQLINLGTFRLTGYCSCEKCCGIYALNRPKDENGKDIVYGSIGERLIEGYSIAVDPTVIPYGTEVIINGNKYVAQDCGSAIKGNSVDIYFESHKEASEFGVQYADVYIEAED